MQVVCVRQFGSDDAEIVIDDAERVSRFMYHLAGLNNLSRCGDGLRVQLGFVGQGLRPRFGTPCAVHSEQTSCPIARPPKHPG